MNRYGLGVREQRWPWLLTACLMLAAAAATGRSTYLYWLPCRGSMLSSIIRRSVQGPDDGDFPHACLRQMDGDVALVQPWTSELNIIAMALLGVAWLTLVVELGWRWRTKVVAALPGVATLAVALAEPWRAATRDKPLPTCRSTVTNFVRPRWVGSGSGIVSGSIRGSKRLRHQGTGPGKHRSGRSSNRGIHGDRVPSCAGNPRSGA